MMRHANLNQEPDKMTSAIIDIHEQLRALLDREGAIRHKILGKAAPEGLDRIVRSLL